MTARRYLGLIVAFSDRARGSGAHAALDVAVDEPGLQQLRWTGEDGMATSAWVAMAPG